MFRLRLLALLVLPRPPHGSGRSQARRSRTASSSTKPVAAVSAAPFHAPCVHPPSGSRCSFPAKSSFGALAANSEFRALGISDRSLRALREIFRYDVMTDVQAQALPTLLPRESAPSATVPHVPPSAVIQARTGTGKTLTYLLPAIERLARAPTLGVGALVIAPSRELVLQITREAEMLCTYHDLQVVPMISGLHRERDVSAIRKRRPAMIVATPGRLLEHFEATFRFQTLFEALWLLVLDECDRLLEAFSDEVNEIRHYLPHHGERRSFLVSATVPNEVRDLAARLCGAGYDLIDCVGTGVPTLEAVEQVYAVCPALLALTALVNLIAEEMARHPTSYKIMVFFPTARLAAFVAQIFRDRLKMRVYEIHSRLDGPLRIITQHEFHHCASGILLTSGVSERGLDYTDVSLVVQLFAPESREQYIHRVGRTARSGRSGVAVLLLLDREVEAGFLKCVDDLPLERHPGEAALLHDEGELLANAASSAAWPSCGPLPAAASAAFASLLTHYKERQRAVALEADTIVETASEILLGCGVAEPPSVSHRLALELGIEGCSQLRIAGDDERGGVVKPAIMSCVGSGSAKNGRFASPRWRPQRSRSRAL